jgi:2-polyprenyl-3-methyl-5-hydroxy-6-metoxy-1,4-benzoquinol methylase
VNLKTRSYKKELLDQDNIPFKDIMATMTELNQVNSYLGGHNITRKGVDFFLNKTKNNETLTIAEIGCGGGDNLASIHNYLIKRNQGCSLIGVDIKQDCIRYAQEKAPTGITWICSDYQTVKWPGRGAGLNNNKPDIIFSSLFCHHFGDEQLVSQLLWLKQNSRMGFFINDLHRHPVAYYSISLLTRLFSRSHLVKNDGPLSVRRAFKKSEWIKLLAQAGISAYTIKWRWAFRYLICVSNEQ